MFDTDMLIVYLPAIRHQRTGCTLLNMAANPISSPSEVEGGNFDDSCACDSQINMVNRKVRRETTLGRDSLRFAVYPGSARLPSLVYEATKQCSK